MLMTPSHDGGVPPLHRFKWMAEHGCKLQELGYPLLPIAPGAKYPGLFDGMSWRGFTGWQGYAMAASTEEQVEEWSGWPGAGIGIPCGLIGGLDLDILDAEACLAAYELAGKALGPPLTYRVGLAPKRLIPYRMAEPFAKVKHGPMEFLALGQQFVAYGIHPDTQSPYHWPVEELSDIPFAELPVVTEQQVRAFMAAAYERLPPGLRTKAPERDRSGEVYYARGGDQRGTWEATAAAVEHIPVGDDSHDAWIKLGLAIKGSVGDRGLELWDRWSRQSAKYKPGECARRWAAPSFAPRDVGFGHLWTRATEAGWQPPGDLIFSQERADQLAGLVEHRAQPWLDRIKAAQEGNFDPETGEVIEGEIAVIEDTDNALIPLPPLVASENLWRRPGGDLPGDDLAREAGGILGLITDWLSKTAHKPQPILNLGAAIALCGALMGHQYKYTGAGDLRTNVMILGLAGSGAGKNHPIKQIAALLEEAGLRDFNLGRSVGSTAGIISAITRHFTGALIVDEAGKFFSRLLSDRCPAHLAAAAELMTTLATSATGVFVDDVKAADRDPKAIRWDVPDPCFCLYGVTVGEPLWESLNSGLALDGFLARLIILQTPDDDPDEQYDAEKVSLRRGEVAQALLHLVVGAGTPVTTISVASATGGRKPKIEGKGESMTRKWDAPDPYDVPATFEAVTLMRKLGKQDQIDLRASRGNDNFSSIIARRGEYTAKMALIRAVSRDPFAPVIEEEDVIWGRGVVVFYQKDLIKAVEDNVSDGKWDATVVRINKIIRDAKGWIPQNEITRRTQRIPPRERADALAQLLEAGKIEARALPADGGNGGRARTEFRIARRR